MSLIIDQITTLEVQHCSKTRKGWEMFIKIQPPSPALTIYLCYLVTDENDVFQTVYIFLVIIRSGEY